MPLGRILAHQNFERSLLCRQPLQAYIDIDDLCYYCPGERWVDILAVGATASLLNVMTW